MNVLSLFSGIGGLDLGLERAGMTVVGQVEIDPWCRKVLAKHWPEVPRHDDVRTAADWWGGRDAPDLVCGGFPCQPVSSAGRRLAQADERWLWPAMAEVIRRLRPAYALMENVPGLLARGMGDVLGDLAACGYDTEWDCVPAAAVGAPHRRDRVWIVAHTRRDTRDTCRPSEPSEGARRRDAGRGPVVASVAYTNGAAGSSAGGSGQTVLEPSPVKRPGRRGSGGPGDVAHATQPERRTTQPQGLAAAGWRAPEPRERDSSGRPIGDWWAVEPAVGRVAHGIPARVDRLRGLGNAVVPQVAEHVGRLILAGAA